VESINNNLGGNDILLNKLQSDFAVKKAGAGSENQESESLGNILHSFGGILKDQISNINQLQNDANQAQQTYATGGNIELHTVMLAAEKADLSLQLAMQVRNKLVAAYQEMTHMTI
jgi:flagellar hook-basal body complex protein FliE